MFERIQSFFNSLTASHTEIAPDDPLIAVAALCIQVMEADGTVSDSEKERLRTLLREHYGRDGASLEALIEAGREAGNEAVDYYRFTADLKRHLDEDQRAVGRAHHQVDLAAPASWRPIIALHEPQARVEQMLERRVLGRVTQAFRGPSRPEHS